MVLQCWNI